MVGINRLPPVGGSSGPSGMSSPENNKPQTPPPTPSSKALTNPTSMSNFISGPMTRWLTQSASAYSRSDLSDLQRQMSDTASSLNNPSTSITESLSQFNDLMGQLGFPLSDTDMAQQMQTASSSLDSSAQKQLSSYTSQVQSAASKVHAAAGSNMQANETLEEMEQTAQQLTSLASGLSSAANATEQLATAVQEGARGSSMIELTATFGSVATQADTFNFQMSQAQGALAGQLSKIQAGLKTVQAEAASSAVSLSPCPYPAVYNAVDQLWLLWMENPNAQHGISSTPPQNLYLLASAVNNIYSAITSAYGSPPSGMPPDIANIYNDITNTSSLMSGQSLQQLCFGGGLAAQDNLFNNLAGVNVILTGNGSGTPSLWTDMNTFFSDYSPPSTTDNSTINGDMYSLIEAIQSGNWSSVASTIQSLNTSLGSASPLDGFLATLQNLLNAPLDANNDTLLSLSSSSPPNTTELQSLLGPGGSLSSLFNSFSSDGSNGSMLGLILYWEGQG